MTDVVKDINKVWNRLFDHTGFVNGETLFMLREFEQKRKDKEVDCLFRVIENITEIKDTEIDKLNKAESQIENLKDNLDLALHLCDKLVELEDKFKQDTTLEETRSERKVEWDKFMDGITSKYSEIDSSFEGKEKELIKFYEDIENKLLI